MSKSPDSWRPIPGFDGYEMDREGRVRLVRSVEAAADGTVALRGVAGRKYRSVRRLLADVWPEAVPAAFRPSDVAAPEPAPAEPKRFRFHPAVIEMQRQRQSKQ